MPLPVSDIVEDLAPTGVLRAAINLGNPVLAQGTPAAPSGVTVDIAREVGRQLAVPLRFACFDAARKSVAAMSAGHVDICFVAIEPARASELAFTAPYVIIEGVFAVAVDSDITTPADVDREHVRIGVKRGSAYDLFLTRTLHRAEVVRGDEGTDIFREQHLDVAAGIRSPMTDFVARNRDLRLIDDAFMEIRQALATSLGRRPETHQFLADTIEELTANGFVREALTRSRAQASDGGTG